MPTGVYLRTKQPWHHTKKARKKMSLSNTGKKHSEETKRKIGESLKGRTYKSKGKPWSEARRKAQPTKSPYSSRGKEYSEDWREIRKEIYRRDNWRCRECGVKNTLSGKSKIQCHHIDFNIENNFEDNLITLCASCHAKTNFKRKDWISYYKNKMEGV